MIKNKSICLLIASLFAIAPAMAQEDYNPIPSSVYSLGISPDAIASGMGDVGAATNPDVYSHYWNPSKYPFIESKAGFALSYTPWLSQLASDIDLVSVMGYYKLDDVQSLSGSLRYFSLGEVIIRETYGEVGYAVEPYEMVVDFGYSRLLSEKFSMGVSLRYILSDLMSDEDPSGKTVAADISGYYRTPMYVGRERGSFGLGFNMSNIGGKISYDGGNTNYFLPANLRVGTSVKMPFDDYNALTLSADVNKLLVPSPRDSTDRGEGTSPIKAIFTSFNDAPNGMKEELQEIYWSVGAEYAYNDQFFVRGGYYHEHENKGNRKYYTFGAGFKMNMLRLDASYLVSQQQNTPLDGTLRFSLAFDMEGIGMLLGR